MSSGGDRDLTKFTNPSVMWKTIKKGPRSESRCARKPADSNIKVGAGLGSDISKKRDSSVLKSEKLAVLGEHATDKSAAVPIKKRRLLLSSPLPPPRTPSLNQEGSLSPHPNTSSSDHEEQGSDDFPGVTLLATVACGGSVDKVADHVEPLMVEERSTTKANDLLTAGTKSSESEASSVPENALPVELSLHCGNENDREEKCSVPPEKVKFHWDLNLTMDEWEEPVLNLPPSSPNNCAEAIADDGLHSQNLNMEGCRRKEFDNTGCERKSVALHSEISSNKSDKSNLFVPPASVTTNSQADLIGDSRGQGFYQGYSDYTTTNDFLENADAKKVVPMYHGKLFSEEADQDGFHSLKSCKGLDNDKLASEDPQGDVCGSEVFQHEQRQLADGDSMIKVQEGYESPYEDGELRETIVHAWNEKEVEGRENEGVDFGLDNQYKVDYDTRVDSLSEKFVLGRGDKQTTEETSLLVEKNVDVVPGNDIMQHVDGVLSKPNGLLSLKTSGGYQPQEPYDDIYLEGKETNYRFYSEIKNGHDETRTSGGNMLPIEGSPSFSGMDRSGTAYMKRSRSSDVGETYFQTEREYGSEEVMGRERLPFQGRWVDSTGGFWESRNPYANPRSRNVIGDSDGRPSGFDSHDSCRSKSYDPRGMYRPLNRRQSPTERNDSYDFHRGRQTMRGFSRDRSRGRSGYTSQEFRRGPQEKYHEPGPYYLERKERAFSPSFSRDSHIGRRRRRSRSRSRSVSPIAWNMHTRSTRRHTPDFRPEGRAQGERFSIQKSSSSSDFEQRFMSPPRGRRVSPQRYSRYYDDRKCMDGQYRDRRSSPPERMFRRNPRFDSGDYDERTKSSGDYFRPVTRPGRFPQRPGDRQGSRNYDEISDDRRKPDERYDRMRRYDTGAGGTGRFRYDAGDCFELRDAPEEDGYYGRIAAPSSINEERSPLGIHEEKLTNTNVSSSIQEEGSAPGIHPEKLTNTEASSSIQEERSFPGIHLEKLTNNDASSSIQEERCPPGIHQEKLSNTDASSSIEEEGSPPGFHRVKLPYTDASSSIQEERSPHGIHQVKLIDTDASSSIQEEKSPAEIHQEIFTNTDASFSIQEERNPPEIHQEKLTKTDALFSIQEERSPPEIHQEKLTKTDASFSIQEERSPPKTDQEMLASRDASFSTQEERIPPGTLQEKMNIDASFRTQEERSPPGTYQEKLNTTDASFSTQEERSPPGTHQPKLNNTDASFSSQEERSPPGTHQETLTNTDASAHGEQDFDVNASTKEV